MRQWIKLAEYVSQTAMERGKRSRIQWFFPVNEQLKAIRENKNKHKVKTKISEGQSKETRGVSNRMYTQTKIQCHRPQGG